MKLSENFFLQEFKADPNNLFHVQNYTMLAHFGLEPIRKKFGGPVVITSGYRSKEYNQQIGGSDTSQHVLAEAVDFLIPRVDMKKVYDFACKEMNWSGQCFFYARRGFVHLALPRVGLAPTKKIMEVNK